MATFDNDGNGGEHTSFIDYKGILLDTRRVINLDRMNEKAHEKVIKCCLNLGYLDELEVGINKLKAINPQNDIIKISIKKSWTLRTLKTEAESRARERKFKEAIEKLDEALCIATACEHFNSLIVQYGYAEKNQKKVYIYLIYLLLFLVS